MTKCMLYFGAFSIVLMAVGIAQADARIWKSADGTFQIEAELVELLDANTVRLRRVDGQVIDVPTALISEADRDFINSRPGRPKTALAVEAVANTCGSATEALALYEAFFADPMVADSERVEALERLKAWRRLAATDSIRAGTQWVTAEDAKRMNAESREGIEQGLEFLRLNNFALAKAALERASQIDPVSNRADFILGLIYALRARNLDKAKTHFRECVKRDSSDVLALNNLSLVELKQRNYDVAASLLRRATELSPRTPMLSQNLGRLIDQTGKGRIPLSIEVQSEFGELYSSLIRQGGSKFNSSQGWLYLLPRRPAGIPLAANEQQKGAGNQVVSTGGIGVVVSPGYVLTLSSVVGGAESCLIQRVGRDGDDAIVRAKVVRETAERDLVLLACGDVSGPIVPFSKNAQKPGSSVAIFDFATLTEKSPHPLAVGGRITASQNLNAPRVTYSLNLGTQLSGGPVCDTSGNIIGLHLGSYLDGKIGVGISAHVLVEFLSRVVEGYQPREPGVRSIGTSGVEAQMRESVVIVLREEHVMDASELGLSSSAAFVEDITCGRCFGIGTIECPERSCARGNVPGFISNTLAIDAITKRPIVLDTRINVSCITCSGAGRVRCPVCGGTGNDPELRR